MSRRPPGLVRFLEEVLIRGEGSEFVRGDLAERHRADLEKGVPRRQAGLRALRRVTGSAVAWWTPGAVRRRVLAEKRERARGGRPLPSVQREGEEGRMGAWTQDLRTTVRGLRRRAPSTAGVVVTLALGIGITTAVFSVVDGVLLRPLPFEDASRLAMVGATFPTREWADEEAGRQYLAGISMQNLRDYDERNRSFSALVGIEMSSFLLPDRGDGPEIAPAARVGEGFFALLGITPALGRSFLPVEHGADAPDVVLLSYGGWLRRTGADPDVVGRTLQGTGSAATIVGVLPPDMELPSAVFGETPDFWRPLRPDHARYADRGMRSLHVLGRLRSEAQVTTARLEARAIATELAAEHPDGNRYPDGSHLGIGVNGLKQQTVGDAARPLAIVLGAALLLLALASMNAATLLLARALDRVDELAVRRALGAGRARVVRLLLTEAVVLALAGCALGIALAFWAVDAFVALAPDVLPRVGEVSVDARVLAAAVFVSLTAGVTAGLIPSLRVTRGSPGRLGGGRGETGAGESGLRAVLVGAQVTLAVVLVSGAVLLSSSFVRIVSTDPGFDPDGLITMRVELKRPGAPQDEAEWQAWDGALEALASVPAVQAVSGTTNPPFQSPFWAPRILLPGDPSDTWREGVAGYAVTPGYFETLGAHLVSGREFQTGDGPDATPVAIVNEAFVRALAPRDEVLGMTLRHHDGEEVTELRIVGVVGDMVQTRAEDGALPAVYVPYTQSAWPMMQAVVRTELPAETVIPDLRRALARFSPAVPPRDVRTLTDRISHTRTDPRFRTLLALSFAAVVLLLAALGLFGSISHAVRRRQRELGLRMALGARRWGVLRLVMARGMRVVAGGLAVGLLLAVALNRLLEGSLFGVEPGDPLSLLISAALLAAVCAVACAVPAMRATSVDPVRVLSAE